MCPRRAGVRDCLRRTHETETRSRGGNLCCNVASINSSAPMRHYLTLVNWIAQTTCILFWYIIITFGEHQGQFIKMKGINWREDIILALSQWNACWIIWKSGVSRVMLGHCTDVFFCRSQHSRRIQFVLKFSLKFFCDRDNKNNSAPVHVEISL